MAKNCNNIIGRLLRTARYARAGRGGVGLPGCLETNLNIHILKLWLSVIGRQQQTKGEGRLLSCFMNECRRYVRLVSRASRRRA